MTRQLSLMALLGAGLLLFEVLLTRVLAITLFANLAFAAVALALLGMAIGGWIILRDGIYLRGVPIVLTGLAFVAWLREQRREHGQRDDAVESQSLGKPDALEEGSERSFEHVTSRDDRGGRRQRFNADLRAAPTVRASASEGERRREPFAEPSS